MSISDTENDFEFYLRFVKPLIFNLQEPQDRALAAAWVQKLMNKNSGSEDLRTNYLKLLLFVLQRRKLRGIFVQNPNNCEGLEQFSEANLHEVARDLLEAEKELQDSPESGDFPPYSTEHSADLLEYSAVQYIPNFGVHAYYAISNEPLPTWNRTEKAVFPRGIIRRSTTRFKITASRFSITESAPSLDEQNLIEKNKTVRRNRSGSVIRRSLVAINSRSKSRRDKSKLSVVDNVYERESQGYAPRAEARRASPRRNKMANVPVSSPLGVNIVAEEMRDAPVWGSNLIQVSEPPIWEMEPPEFAERESEYMEYQPDTVTTDSVCYSSSIYRGLPYQSQSPRRPSSTMQDQCVPCCNSNPQKRPQSAAAAERENCYFSENQANYVQAMSMSNVGSPAPCRAPSPPRRHSRASADERGLDINQRPHSFDVPGEGEVRLLRPNGQSPVLMDEGGFAGNQGPPNFEVPYEGGMGVAPPRAQSSIPIDEGNFDLNQRPAAISRKCGVPRANGQIHESGGSRILRSFEGEVPVPMDERSSNSIRRLSASQCETCSVNEMCMRGSQKFMNIDRPRGQMLPPIAEREQDIYNLEMLSKSQAEVDRFIKQTLLNTKKIDEDLQAFDRFIAEYEKADLGA